LTAYEKSDAKVGTLAIFAVSIFLLVLISLTGVAIMWRVMAYSTVYEGEMAGSPLAPMRPLPPSPRLQTTPAADLKEVREQEDQLLHSYGWVDKSQGVVRISIDRAMDSLATRGLPEPQQKPEAAKTQPEAAKK
jgi:hypothetical protein